jgi:hypothetical protein
MTTPNNSFKNLILFFAMAVLLSVSIVIPIEKAHSATSLAVIPSNSDKTTSLAIEASPFYEAKVGKITGQRVVSSTNGGSPQIEQSIIENGTIKGVGNVTNLQTWTNTLRSPKIYYGIGQGIITTADGQDMATWTGYDIGRSNIGGVITYHGITFFNTNSTGKLAFLKNLEGLHITEVEGNKQVTKIWEWPAANSTKAAGNATTTTTTAANSTKAAGNATTTTTAANSTKAAGNATTTTTTTAANSTKAAGNATTTTTTAANSIKAAANSTKAAANSTKAAANSTKAAGNATTTTTTAANSTKAAANSTKAAGNATTTTAANSTKAAGNATAAANSSSLATYLSKSKVASNVPTTTAANSTKAATTAAASNNKGSILDPITRLGQSIASGLKGLGNLITGNKK